VKNRFLLAIAAALPQIVLAQEFVPADRGDASSCGGYGHRCPEHPHALGVYECRVLADKREPGGRFRDGSGVLCIAEVGIAESWMAGAECVYTVKSYDVVSGSGLGRWRFSHTVFGAGAAAHYVVAGQGYRLKVGGGLGWAWSVLEETAPFSSGERAYRSSGPAGSVSAMALTAFDETFYGYIGGDLQWVAGGTFVDETGRRAEYNTTEATAQRVFGQPSIGNCV